jgi:hypothetical protein
MTEPTVEELDQPQLAQPQKRVNLLVAWKDVLSNIEKSRSDRIEMSTAHRVITTWPHLNVRDVRDYVEMYHDFLTAFRAGFLDVLDEEPDALLFEGEEDGTENRGVYMDVILMWQKVAWEIERTWDPDDSDSNIMLAAFADAVAFFLGPKGLVAHIDQIGIEFTEVDGVILHEALETWKAGL